MVMSIPKVLGVYIKKIQQLTISIMTGGIIRAPASNSEILKVVLQCCGKIICYYLGPRYTCKT